MKTLILVLTICSFNFALAKTSKKSKVQSHTSTLKHHRSSLPVSKSHLPKISKSSHLPVTHFNNKAEKPKVTIKNPRSNRKLSQIAKPEKVSWGECKPNEALNTQAMNSYYRTLVNKYCKVESNNQVRTENQPSLGRKSSACLLAKIYLAAEIIVPQKTLNIQNSAVQCIFDVESSDKNNSAVKHIPMLYPEKISPEEMKDGLLSKYKYAADTPGGNGLGQLTPDALKAVSERLTNTNNFDCDLYQRYLAYFTVLDEIPPNNIQLKDKRRQPYFGLLTASHNIAASVSYMHIMAKHLRSHGKTSKNSAYFSFLVAKKYRGSKIEKENEIYGGKVRTCSQDVQATIKQILRRPDHSSTQPTSIAESRIPQEQ